jgi:hypothetical protein
MDDINKLIVHRAIRKHGDDFWNDKDIPDEEWNGFLFDEILSILEKEGYTLELVKLT